MDTFLKTRKALAHPEISRDDLPENLAQPEIAPEKGGISGGVHLEP